MTGLLSLRELPTEKIKDIVSQALCFKNGTKSVRYPGKKMATLFFEDSTRTLYSFHAAMLNLGITPVPVNCQTSSMNKGETLYDTVKTLENIGYDGVVIRSRQEGYYHELTGIQIPVFNGGDGAANHPTQTLLDLVTVYEEYGRFEGLKVCLVGDIAHSRVAHGNAEIMKRLGMDVTISGPPMFMDDTAPYVELDRAVEESDIMMLLRVQFERHQEKMGMTVTEYHHRFGLTRARANKMPAHAIIMHPAPFNRGVEIASEVVECAKSRINEQMKNGVFVRMAVISAALEGAL